MKLKDQIVSWTTLLGCIAGAVFGLVRPDWALELGPIGNAYITILKVLALPTVIVSVFRASVGGGRKAAGILLRALFVFIVMFAVTFLLSAVLYELFSPGTGFSLMGEIAWQGGRASLSFWEMLQNAFSPNRLKSVNSLFFPSIILAFLLGVLMSMFRSDALEKYTASVERFFTKLLSYVMLLTPLGVFSLMAKFTGSFGMDALRSSGVYIAWAYCDCILSLGTVMILPLWIICGVGPGQYFRRTGRLFLTALSTCSSAATLPETMRTCREAFGASERTTGIVAPLGCTVHMCGGAVSFCLLVLFVQQMAGRPLSLGMLVTMLLFALLLNMAAPGIPGGGIVLGATYLGIKRGAVPGHVRRDLSPFGHGLYLVERCRRRDCQCVDR